MQEKIIKISLISFLLLSFIAIVYLFNKGDEKNVLAETESILKTTSVICDEVDDDLYVDVKGSVKKPGVYKLEETNNVIDAIKAAGGLKSDADTSNINLAESLKDEMVIYVSNKKETKQNKLVSIATTCIVPTTNITTTTKNITTKASIVNINTGSLTELMEIPEIGEAKAEAIIEYRRKTPFVKIEDIKNVTGIGEAVFAKIKNYITI